jgi:hypothetical protein
LTSRDQAFFLPLYEKLRAFPGIKNVSCAMSIGMGSPDAVEVSIPGIEPPSGQKGFRISSNGVAPNYFRTVGMRLARGSSFDAQDAGTGQEDVFINEKMAERFWPHADPIGKHIEMKDRSCRIIGIVKNAGDFMNIHKAPAPCIYYSLGQMLVGNIIIETAEDPRLLASAIKREIFSIDKDATILSMATMNERLGIALWADRILFILVGALGCIGIFLTAAGLYGVVAYLMQRRIQEIGIRLALGADGPEYYERASIPRAAVAEGACGRGANCSRLIALTEPLLRRGTGGRAASGFASDAGGVAAGAGLG